jgi:D-xylose transport system substrate-binding protein
VNRPVVGRLVAVFLVAVLVGCSKTAPVPAAHHPVRIGLSMDSFVVERWIRDRDIFVAEAEALGATVLVQVANQDHETQVAQIKALSGQGIDVLVVVPNDSTRLGPTVQEVRNRGIPVISYDRLILRGKADLYIAHDHVAAGALMAQAVVEASQKKRSANPFQVIIVNGARPDHNSALMSEGFHRALDPAVQGRRLTIVREVWLNSWSSEEAETAFRTALDETQTRPDAVIAANDLLAESLIRVLSQRRWLDGTFVTGMDADLAACQRVIEGTQSMTVYKPIAPLAMAAARYAVKLARHESLDIQQFISDGEYNIPYVKHLPVAVDRSNMREVIVKEGFHRAEEIYRNPPKP